MIFRIARGTHRLAVPRPFLAIPLAGMAVAGLAIAFSQAADKSVSDVLFSGENSINSLVANPGDWSLSALALLLAFKGLAYGLSLGTFRGGPTFPAMLLGAAGGMMAAQLPGFGLTPAVAVGIGRVGRLRPAAAPLRRGSRLGPHGVRPARGRAR